MKNLLTEKNFMWLAIVALAVISFSHNKGRCGKCEMGARMSPMHQVDRGQSRARWKRYQESDEHSRANRGTKTRAKREIKNTP